MSAEIVSLVSDLAKATPRIIVVMSQSLDKRLAERQKELSTLPVKLIPKQMSSTEIAKIDDDFNKTLSIAHEKLPPEEFKTTISSSIENYYKNRYFDQRRYFLRRHQQARVTSIVAIALLITGALIILAGITLVFFSSRSTDTTSVVSGTITEVLGALVLGFNKLLNDRLDETTKKMNFFARTHDAMSYIDQITDPERKGKALEELLRKILIMQDFPAE